jgi:oligo-alginate lyase
MIRSLLLLFLLTSCLEVLGHNYNRITSLPKDNYLLTNRTEIEAAKEKARKFVWARRALEEITSRAKQSLAIEVRIPERGGPNGLYACTRDGFKLEDTANSAEFKCPECNAVYKGRFYRENDHRKYSDAVLNLGLAYRLTDNREFATKAKEILLAYSDRYTKFSKHGEDGERRPNGAPNGARLFKQTLGESRWLVPIVWGYSLIRDSLRQEERDHIEKDLLIPAGELLRAHHWGVHNKQAWMNAGFGLVGFVTGNREWIKEAIEDKQRGFETLVTKGVSDEGFWWEGSTSYHAMTRQAMTYLALAAFNSGINLYSERFLKMFDVPVQIAFPDGNLPVFNDSSGGEVTDGAGLYEVVYARTRKPLYAQLIASTERDSIFSLLHGERDLSKQAYLPHQSTILPGIGMAMLRSNEVAVAVRFGVHGGWHGHFDKLGIITYGLGNYFGLDPGSAGYSNPMHDEWNRTTLSHNTVVMSQTSQEGLNSFKVEDWKTEGGVTTLVVSTDSAYSDAVLKRSLRLEGNRLTDRFDCISDLRHQYDWVFHSHGAFTTSLKMKPRRMKLGSSHGYQFVENLHEAVTEADFWVTWELNGVRLRINFKGEPGTEVYTGVGPARDGRIPMVIVRRRGVGVTFDATHIFERMKRD